jgi:O-antigen/teichoic acid export membrane protein
MNTRHPHPLYVLARIVGFILALACAVSHLPLTAAVFAFLAGYAGTLLAMRGHWHCVTTQAGKAT